MARWALDRFVALAAIGYLVAYVFIFATGRAGPPIRSDGFSYYVYLPSWLLYHDTSLQAVADDCCGGVLPAFSAIVRWPSTGHWVNAHPIGVAVLTLPFFLAAHLLTKWTNLSPDGFTLYYQHAAGLAGLFYAVAGLWFLRRLLSRHFSAGVTLATLAALLLGTSLLHYATHDSTWSHAFSLCLLAALLERLDTGPGTLRDMAVLGVISGLIVLTRHTNVLFPAILIPWRVRQPRALCACAAVATLVVLPQLLLYYAATGRLLVSSYGSLRFTFTSPHIWGVLFSVQKGAFFWAPVLLAGVIGLGVLPQDLRWLRAPACAALGLDTYLIASWWDWQFGASFGHRGFVDAYPLVAPGLASALAWIAARPPAWRAAAAAGVAVACGLTFFETLQYWNGVLPHSDITWAQYTSVFLRWR